MEDVGEALGHEPEVGRFPPNEKGEGGVEKSARALKLWLDLSGERRREGGREGATKHRATLRPSEGVVTPQCKGVKCVSVGRDDGWMCPFAAGNGKNNQTACCSA